MEFDWKLVSCYDVVATIRGAKFPDEWVVRGNHHDAWVNGAQDPYQRNGSYAGRGKKPRRIGKTRVETRSHHYLFQCMGWRRTRLIGSTEWAEDHGSELQQKCVAYINSDGNGRVFFPQAVRMFLNLCIGTGGKVNDPQTNVSVLDRLNAARW